jgi:hypothetical protein
MKEAIRAVLRSLGYDIHKIDHRVEDIAKRYPVHKPLNPEHVAVLADPAFQRSVVDTAPYTLLDTPRLANLWQICRRSDPAGAMMEIGTYRGGGALHLSNCFPERQIIVCDSFEGFKQLDKKLDAMFTMDMFKDTSFESVAKLFSERKRRFEVIPGFFPESCKDRTLPPISFVHLDIDLYEPTLDSLMFLDETMMASAYIVLDDYLRSAEGIVRAVDEFLARRKNWVFIPLFPGQGVLVRK